MNQQYDRFIDDLIKQKDFSDLTPGEEEQLKKEVRERLDNFLLNRIVATLPDHDMKELTNLVQEKKSQEEIFQFIASHIDNYETFVGDAFGDFAYAYLGQ